MRFPACWRHNTLGTNPYILYDKIMTNKNALHRSDPDKIDSAEALHDAIKQGDIEAIQDDFATTYLNLADQNGDAPLHTAIEYSPDTVRKLLKFDAVEIEATNNDGMTPLTVAAANGQAELVELLLEHGARTQPDQEGDAPIIEAARNKNATDALCTLLESDPDSQDVVDRALVQCIPGGGRDNVVMIAKNDAVSQSGRQEALLRATRKNEIELVRCLLKNGARLNRTKHTNTTPLQIALSNRHFNLVDLLLEKGADPTSTDSDGHNALRYLSKQLVEIGGRPSLNRDTFKSYLFRLLNRGATLQSDYLEFLETKAENADYHAQRAARQILDYYDRQNIPVDTVLDENELENELSALML